MGIAELELLIRKEKSELSNLIIERDSTKQQVIYNAGDGQVGYRTMGQREGLDKEIAEKRQKISALEKQLIEQKQNKELNTAQERQYQNDLNSEKIKEQEEEKQYEEMRHKSDFQRVRDIYKSNTNFLERAILKFKGKGLKSSSAYTKEELEYLIATYKGDTVLQQMRIEQIEKRYSAQEIPSKIKENNIAGFKRMVSNGDLSEYIELEEMNHGGRSR